MIRRALATVLLAALLAPGGARAAARPEPALRIGAASRLSPQETVGYYDKLLRAVGERLGRRIELVQFKTYEEMDSALARRDLDFAFVCSGCYVRDRKAFGAQLLAAPQSHGQPFYYSYVIVPANGPARSIADLRGKRFVFADPLSNSGRLAPSWFVAHEFALPAEKYFGAVSYSWAHDRSIDLVNRGETDGAAVDSHLFDYVAKRSLARVGNVRIVWKSPPFGMPPLVANAAADPKLKARLQRILLALHEEPGGRRILADVMIDRFVVPPDANYDSIREMAAWLAAGGGALVPPSAFP